MIHKVGKVRKVAKIPKIREELPQIRRPAMDKIPVRPGPRIGQAEDPLEKAAIQGVPGSLPERIVWKWLEDNDHIYEAQLSEDGGRLIVGGSVVDFVVYDLAPFPVALRVQGDYWHGPSFPERQRRDDEQRVRLSQQGYIVVDLWEHDIYEAVLQEQLDNYIMDAVVDAA